jgi:hypothetical protein
MTTTSLTYNSFILYAVHSFLSYNGSSSFFRLDRNLTYTLTNNSYYDTSKRIQTKTTVFAFFIILYLCKQFNVLLTNSVPFLFLYCIPKNCIYKKFNQNQHRLYYNFCCLFDKWLEFSNLALSIKYHTSSYLTFCVLLFIKLICFDVPSWLRFLYNSQKIYVLQCTHIQEKNK